MKKKTNMRIPKAARELEKRKEMTYVKGMLAQQVRIYSIQSKITKRILQQKRSQSKDYCIYTGITAKKRGNHSIQSKITAKNTHQDQEDSTQCWATEGFHLEGSEHYDSEDDGEKGVDEVPGIGGEPVTGGADTTYKLEVFGLGGGRRRRGREEGRGV